MRKHEEPNITATPLPFRDIAVQQLWRALVRAPVTPASGILQEDFARAHLRQHPAFCCTRLCVSVLSIFVSSSSLFDGGV